MRQSTVTLGRISHIFQMKVDSDPDEWQSVFCRMLQHFSQSVHLDVSAHFSAVDDEEFFVVEGSGWQGRRESLRCHVDKHMSSASCPHHNHHKHHHQAF